MNSARPSPAVTRGKPARSSGSGASAARVDAAEPIDLTPMVSDVLGAGADAHRLVQVGPWKFTALGADGIELEIPDAALADRMGMEVRRLRELSERHENAGNIAPRVCRTVRQTGGRPGNQRFYNEADALFLVTRSETKRAVALTKEMIAVYMAARRGLLRPAVAGAPLALDPSVRAALDLVPVLVEQTKAITAALARHDAQFATLAADVASHAAELASGIIGPEKGREIRRRIYDAARRASGGDKALTRSFSTGRSTWIRNAVQFTGPRTAWRNLPRASLAKVETLVDAVERDAEDLARRHRESRASAAAAKQGDLPFKPN